VVVVPPVVESQEDFYAMPRGLDCVGVVSGLRMHELEGMVDGAVRVTEGFEIVVRTPAITNDGSARFDPVM
jgi:hypothetical protein